MYYLLPRVLRFGENGELLMGMGFLLRGQECFKVRLW